MAMPAFPYPLAFLADLLDIESVEFDVDRYDQVSGQGSGRLISAELMPPLWYATVTLNPAYFEDAEVIAAKFRRLSGPLGTFLLYDPRKLYPKNDPTGVIIGANVITIVSIGADNDELTLGGFPAGYILSPGDKMSYTYGGSSRAFLEVSDYATADGAGQITVPVFPHVPLGTTAGIVVTFVKPSARMQLNAKGWIPGKSSGLHTTGQSFRAIQKV